MSKVNKPKKNTTDNNNINTSSPTSALNRLTDLIGLTSSQENTTQPTPVSKPGKNSDTNSETKKASIRINPYFQPNKHNINTKKQKHSHVIYMKTDNKDI